MGKKAKIVFLITLVIKNTEIKPVKNIPIKVEKNEYINGSTKYCTF